MREIKAIVFPEAVAHRAPPLRLFLPHRHANVGPRVRLSVPSEVHDIAPGSGTTAGQI